MVDGSVDWTVESIVVDSDVTLVVWTELVVLKLLNSVVLSVVVISAVVLSSRIVVLSLEAVDSRPVVVVSGSFVVSVVVSSVVIGSLVDTLLVEKSVDDTALVSLVSIVDEFHEKEDE